MTIYKRFAFIFFVSFFLIYEGKAIAAEKEAGSKPHDFNIYIGAKDIEKQNKQVVKGPSPESNKAKEEKIFLSDKEKSVSSVSDKKSKPKVSFSDEEAESTSSPTDKNEQQNISLDSFSNEKETSPPSFTPEDFLEEKAKKNVVMETFAPDEEEEGRGRSSLKDNYSWIFDSRRTPQELAVTPIFYMSRTYGPNWGLRFFTFSPDNKGYYLSTSLTNQIFSSLFIWDINYRQVLSKKMEIRTYGQFFNYFEPYFAEKGMDTRIDNEQKLYAHKLTLNSQILFKEFRPFFYGMEIGGIFFKDQEPYIKDEAYFETEFLIWLKLKGGYDSRNNWKDPKSGAHHQVSLACVPLLNESDSYCLMETDLRTYIPLHKQLPFLGQSVLALRGFAGTSLMASPSYSMTYRMGGSHVFRGFTSNRFRGDKIYFGQSELRVPLWKNTISGALFFELGETAEYSKPFSGFLWDFGLGLRFGIPPSYDIKLRMDWGFSTDKFDNSSYNFIVNFFQAF